MAAKTSCSETSCKWGTALLQRKSDALSCALGGWAGLGHRIYGLIVVDAVVAAPVVDGGRVAVAALVAVVVLADAVAAVVAVAAPPL